MMSRITIQSVFNLIRYNDIRGHLQIEIGHFVLVFRQVCQMVRFARIHTRALPGCVEKSTVKTMRVYVIP